MNREQTEKFATEALKLSGYSDRTVKSYDLCIKRFLRHSDKPVKQLSMNDVRLHLLYLKENRDLASSSLNQAYSAIKFLFTEVLSRPWQPKGFRFQRRARRLPVVLTRDEVKTLFEVTDNLKHRAVMMTMYSAGLRLSEVIHLKVNDIDSKAMRIHVQLGKGKKDRYVMLSPTLLETLRVYWKRYRPKTWLFPGSRENRPLHPRAVQRFVETTSSTWTSCANTARRRLPHPRRPPESSAHPPGRGGEEIRLTPGVGRRTLDRNPRPRNPGPGEPHQRKRVCRFRQSGPATWLAPEENSRCNDHDRGSKPCPIS